jgi:hypothetical protein
MDSCSLQIRHARSSCPPKTQDHRHVYVTIVVARQKLIIRHQSKRNVDPRKYV